MTANEGARGEPTAPRPGSPPADLLLDARIASRDVPRLSDRVREVAAAGGGRCIVCDVGAIVHPDVETVDALARLQLVAHRLGRRIGLRRVGTELERLLVLVGLDEVLPWRPASGVEPRRQAEEREQPLGVEEEADPGDPVA